MASGASGIILPSVMGFIAGKGTVTAAIWALVAIAALGACVCLTLKSHKEPVEAVYPEEPDNFFNNQLQFNKRFSVV